MRCKFPPEPPYNIGEGTIFCPSCGTPLGRVGSPRLFEKAPPLWDITKVDIIQKGVPKEVAEQFGGTPLNHGIALNAMDLQAKVDELTEALRKEQAETYRLREISEDDQQHIRQLQFRIADLEDTNGSN